MRSLAMLLVAVMVLPAVCGCGGGMSQAEMRRNAIRRPSDDDDDDRPSPSAVADDSDDTESVTKDVPETRAAVPALAEQVQPSESQPVAKPDVADTKPVEPTESAAIADSAEEKSPERPQTVSERRAWSIANLQRIAAAMQEYAKAKRSFPNVYIRSLAGMRLLSWRVELLPYLGHDELYAKFNLDEAWDSAHNKSLLASIPDVYRSPERFDERTNYLVPSGSGTMFSGVRGFPLRKVEDGLANTVLLLEVDDDASVPWTQPDDYAFDIQQPARSLGNLRKDGFFLAWGDGSVARLDASISGSSWRAIFTPDGGESFSSAEISMTASAEPAAQEVAAVADPGSSGTVVEPAPVPASGSAPAVVETESHRASATTDRQRQQVPTGTSYDIALKDLRARFHADYLAAINAEKKQELAKDLLADAAKVRDDTALYYATLDICRQIAAEAGDITLALRAVDQIDQDFQADTQALKGDVLFATADLRLDDGDNQIVLREAAALIDEAMGVERFEVASQAHAAAIAAARRSRNGRLVRLLAARGDELRSAEKAFYSIAQALETLAEDPEDATANLQLGQYYCFVKRRWEDGLPLLARGSDARLASLAESELDPPRDPLNQMALADRWWNQSERKPEFQAAVRSRAAHWYSVALPGLGSGLEKIRAEMRARMADLSVIPE